MAPVNCILLLGGKGQRFGSFLPKQFHRLGHAPLFQITATSLLEFFSVERLVLSAPADYLANDELLAPLEQLKEQFTVDIECVAGGKSRHHSLVNAIPKVRKDVEATLVHDANRPYLTEAFAKTIIQALSRLDSFDALIPVLPMVDSVCQIDQQGEVTSYVDRAELKRIQTPQICKTSVLVSLPGELDSPPTDEGSWFKKHGLRVGAFDGDPGNKKVTFKEDLSNE